MSLNQDDLGRLIEPVARELFGEPNRQQSSRTELRWGNNGSMSVDLEKGTWFDFEAVEGGGVLAMIGRENGLTEAKDQLQWMEDKGIKEPRADGRREIPRPEPPRVETPKSVTAKKAVAAYDYVDVDGKPVSRVIRYEWYEDGKKEKTFRQFRPDPQQGWVVGLEGVQPPLYRLPEILNAVGPRQRIFVVEGEKDVENLRKLDVIATCNVGGAGKWQNRYVQTFNGADVVVIADNDPPVAGKDKTIKRVGQDHAAEVANALLGTAARVRVLDLGKEWPECPLKGDISDWLAVEGNTRERLEEIVNGLLDWGTGDEARKGNAFGFSWQLTFDGDPEASDDRDYLIKGILPQTGVVLLSGQWGTYKTFVSLDLASSVMTGNDFISFPVKRRGAVLFLACEGKTEVPIRLRAAYANKQGTGNAPFAFVDACPRLLDEHAAKILTAMVQQFAAYTQRVYGLPVALVVIDTAGKAAGLQKTGDLNDDTVAKNIMKTLDEASKATGALFMGVAHFGKNVETGTKGSSGFEDDADVVLALLGEKSQTGKVENPRLCIRKRRFGGNGEEYWFRTEVMPMGKDEDGDEKTTLKINWVDQASVAASNPNTKDRWGESLKRLQRAMLKVLEKPTTLRPWGQDGPQVQAAEMPALRTEYYASFPSTEESPSAKQATKQKAFKRNMDSATNKGLITTRQLGQVDYVWLSSSDTATSLAAVLGASDRREDQA